MFGQSKAQFSVYEAVCNGLIWLIRPLTIPVEMLMHVDVGERYFGFSGLLALILLVACAAWCPTEESSLLNLLATVVLARVVVHRILCVRRRWRGEPMVNSRSEGRPLLALYIKRFPEHTIKAVEPVLVMLTAAVIAAINETLGGYLLCSGLGLLAITVVRGNLAYNKRLDSLDAQIEQQGAIATAQDGQQSVIDHPMTADRILAAPPREAYLIVDERN